MTAIDKWFPPVEGKKRTLSGPYAIAYGLIAAGFAVWYLYTSGFGLVSTETNRGFYLLFTAILVFLGFPARRGAPKHRPSIIDLVFIVLAVASIGYWMDQYVPYAMFRVSDPSQWDLSMGAIAIVVVLETSRRVLGPAIPIIATLFLLQLYFGPYLPGKLSHSGMPVDRIIEFTFSTQEAMFGVVTATFATFVFPFMIFGAFLQRSGAGTFFMDLATALTGQWRGGPAKIATLSSALFGSISGSSVANVVASGAFTIPMMKRIGFKPHHAGAIEAIASTGGQVMPPIMGAGVFILATLTQTEYLGIALMNVIPAILFFFFVLLMVDLEAMRTGLKGLPREEIPKVGDVLRRGWVFFIPLIVVVTLLFKGYSPDFGAFWGTVSALVLSWLRRDTAMGPRSVFRALVGGAHNNTAAGAAIGSLGVIIGGIILSGLGLKFSAVLVEFAGGSLLLTVTIVTIISVIIGMGSSTTGSYIILAVVAAPALIQLGVPEVPAHLVVFYAACLSNITPPVCVSAFAAAAIAKADPMRTGFAALKFGTTLVLVPFSFVYVPELLLQGTAAEITFAAVSYLLGYTALAVAIQGIEFFVGPVALWRRLLFLGAAVCFLLPMILWLKLLGLILLLGAWGPSMIVSRRAAAETRNSSGTPGGEGRSDTASGGGVT